MKLKKIGAAILIVICLGILYFNQNLLFSNPFAEIAIENVVYAARDNQENLLVLDGSGGRLLKVDSTGIVQWIVKSNEIGFSEAKRVVSAENGHIFVQNVEKEEAGYRICRESILEYSKDGEFIRETVVYEYEEAILAPQMIGIVPTEEGCFYLYKQTDELEQHNQEGELLKSYALPEAKQFVASIAYDKKQENLYYSNYRGEIYQYIDGTKDLLLYTGASVEELSVPKEISIDANQTVYVSDIGLRDILKIDSTGNVERIEEDMDIYDKEISYCLNADYGLVVSTNYSVKLLEEGEYTYLTSFEKSDSQKMMEIVVWVAIAVMLFAACGGVYLLVQYILKSKNKFTKISTTMILGVSVLCIVFMGILLPKFEANIIEAVFKRAEMAADITEAKIPLESFEQINSASDFMGPEYLAVREAVNDIFLSGDESMSDLYCTLYRIQDDMIISTYCLQEDTGAIYPYDWYYEESDEQAIIESKEGKQYSNQSSEGSYLFVLNPIIDENTGEAVGLIEVGTDLNAFQKQLKTIIQELVINMIAITVVFILVAIEVILFFQAKEHYEKHPEKGIPTDILRTMVFTVFFLTNMATGFLPIYALDLARSVDTFGIPMEVMAAIPISAEVVTGAIFSIFGNKVIERLGEKKAVSLSAIVFTAGFAFRIIPNIWVLTIGNAIIGIGWGILLLVINTIIARKPEAEKDSGFASYSAAALNGVNCGVVIGGFLMNWLSYQWILSVTTLISVLLFFLVKKYLHSDETTSAEEVEEVQSLSIWKFLFKGRIIIYFAMIVVPIIACSYFLNYMFPILGSEYGLSETNIGYAYLLNGLCVMCFSNVMTEFFGRKMKKGMALALASCIYAVAFLLVGWYQSIPVLLLSLVLLGLSDSFGLPLQTVYYTDLEEVKQFGYDRAIGVYSLFENGAQAMGSFVFSYVLLIGIKEGLWLVAGTIMVLAVLFLLISTGIAFMNKKSIDHSV